MLHLLTIITGKQLSPVHNKLMIVYPLLAFMLVGIREMLIIFNPRDLQNF